MMRSSGTKNIFNNYKLLLILIVMVIGMGEVKGQECDIKTRTYANFQGSYLEGLGLLGSPTLSGSITNPSNALSQNGEVKLASTLTVGVGLLGLAASTQYLEFTTTGNHNTRRLIPANTPVTIKFSLPQSVLSVANGIEVGTFTGLTNVDANWPLILGAGNHAGFNSTNKKVQYSGASLLGLLNAAGIIELTMTPTEAYNGVYLKLSGNGLSLALTSDIYHAYILEKPSAATPVDCNTSVDVLHGVKAGQVDLATATGTVNSPYDAIDQDPSLTTFAKINVGVQLLSKIYHTTLFNTPAQKGDAIKIVLQDPGQGLLDLSLLTGFTIQPYLLDKPAGQPFDNTNTLLNLRLLPGAGNKYELIYPVSESFDRVEISMGGVVGALGSLHIYDVKRIIRPIPIINDITTTNLDICPGIAILDIKEIQDCTTYNWYNTAIGGTSLNNGVIPFTTNHLSVGTHTYYLEAKRANCDETSERIPVTVNVIPLPTTAIAGANQNLCSSVSSTMLDGNAPTSGTGTWILVSKPINNISLNISSPTSPKTEITGLTSLGIYVFKWTIDNGSCKTESNVTITINPTPNLNPIGGSSALCVGQGSTLTNSISGGVWTSSDETKVKINQTGRIVAYAVGTVTITYSVTNLSLCTSSVTKTISIHNTIPTPTITLVN